MEDAMSLSVNNIHPVEHKEIASVTDDKSFIRVKDLLKQLIGSNIHKIGDLKKIVNGVIEIDFAPIWKLTLQVSEQPDGTSKIDVAHVKRSRQEPKKLSEKQMTELKELLYPSPDRVVKLFTQAVHEMNSDCFLTNYRHSGLTERNKKFLLPGSSDSFTMKAQTLDGRYWILEDYKGTYEKFYLVQREARGYSCVEVVNSYPQRPFSIVLNSNDNEAIRSLMDQKQTQSQAGR
jgi:hypothetical protein